MTTLTARLMGDPSGTWEERMAESQRRAKALERARTYDSVELSKSRARNTKALMPVVYRAIKEHPGCKMSDICALIGTSEVLVRNVLTALVDENRITKTMVRDRSVRRIIYHVVAS